MLVYFNLTILRTISYLKVYSYPKLYFKKLSNQKPTVTLADRVHLQNDIRKLFNFVCVFYGLSLFKTSLFTGQPGKPSHKMGFRSSVSKSGHPGEGKHEGLVRRNDVLTNGFIGFSLAWTLARILFVPCLRSPWKTHKALRTWRTLFALFEAIRPWE